MFLESIDQHFKHLNTFLKIIKTDDLVVSAPKMKLFQIKIRYLGHDINKETIKLINRALELAGKFLDEIKDKTQLQRFLVCLNYIADFFPNLWKDCSILFGKLQKNPLVWTDEHTKNIRYFKEKIRSLPCLDIPHPHAFMIVETDASEIGYGGFLKQKLEDQSEQLVRFHSRTWFGPQKNYSTIKKEILSIVLCISKFLDDLYNKKFLLRIDCKLAKEILQKKMLKI